ncbi:hypothetical protein JCM8097_007021 [Rhodosporidiobolus ruineniae]
MASAPPESPAGAAHTSPSTRPAPPDEPHHPPRALAEAAAVVALDSAPLPGTPSAAHEVVDAPSVASSSATAVLDETTAASEAAKEELEEEPERVRGGTKDFDVLPIPKRLQYDSANPPHFGLLLNAFFGFAATFTNLYYPHTILIVLADNFDVSYDEVTNIPTFLQASYAIGLAFICPCGDLVRRRPLLLLLVTISAILTLLLAVVPSVTAFQAISFFLGAASVTPQILLPLVGDLAPANRRASALAIVLSGLLLGILAARVLAGLIAEKASVAALYYMAFGLQILILVLIWLLVPDYPAKNKHLNYFQILGSMVKYMVTEPVLLQACLITLPASAIFTSFWVSSTFIMSDFYGYNSLQIGLFALIGVVGVLAAPFIGRLIDSLVSWVGVFIGLLILLASQAVFTAAAGVHIAALCIVILLLDIGQQLQQVSNSTRIFAINDAARARFSAVFIVWNFAGQLVGTAAGTRVYLQYGYRASGGLAMGFVGWMLFILFLRGPHCPTKQWIGWTGGWELRKAVAERKRREKEEEGKGVERKEV